MSRGRVRKQQLGKKGSSIALDLVHVGRLAGCACADLNLDSGSNMPVTVRDRFILQEETVVFGEDLGVQTRLLERDPEEGSRTVVHPYGQPFFDLFGPLALLAVGRRQRFCSRTLYQIGCESANVIGDIDVFREPTDRFVDLT